MTREQHPEHDEIVERIESHAIPLHTDTPATELPDVEELLDVFRTKSVIGMGEATHGTREFFRMKHRLLELLVERLDVRLFGLEANFPETLAVNRYVLSGDGDSEAALTSIPAHVPVWETEEMLALIEWIRDYNESRPEDDRVRFYGFDAQFTAGAAAAIRRYFERVEPAFLDGIEDTLQMLEAEGLATDDENTLSERLDETRRFVSNVRSRLHECEHSYVEALSEEEWHLTTRRLRVVEQVTEHTEIDVSESPAQWYEIRERAMAENVSWILDHENSDTIALWGHNGHVAKGLWQGMAPKMGAVLAEEFGERYYALGFDFGHGAFTAAPSFDEVDTLQEWSLEGHPPEAIAAEFEDVDAATFFLDISTASADERLEAYLSHERIVRSVGSVFDPEKGADGNVLEFNLSEELDGLVFVTKSSPTRPLERS